MQMSDVPNSHSHDLYSETQGLAEETQAILTSPINLSFFFFLSLSFYKEPRYRF